MAGGFIGLAQPLHALGMFVELLDPHVKGEEARHFVTRVRASSRALSGLLNGLLDISRLDAGTVAVRRQPLALAPLVHRLVLGQAGLAQRKRPLRHPPVGGTRHMECRYGRAEAVLSIDDLACAAPVDAGLP